MTQLWTDMDSADAPSGAQNVWDRALELLRTKVSEHTFDAWLSPVVFEKFEAGALHLCAPNTFITDWINAHYLSDLEVALKQVTQQEVRLVWRIDPKMSERIVKLEEPRIAARRTMSERPALSARSKTMELPFGEKAVAQKHETKPEVENDYALNPRYRFENFVVGTSNQLAHAAALAAANSPGKKFNPLFIYGRMGLGKTHLINAVGHRIREDNPTARVMFLSAERFTNEFIWALQNRRIDEFRARYRVHCEALIIDDIQFLAGREQTQEEFFHTFNALYHADKQIVVTSDVYPQQIGEMQDRLISRFQWGLVADIQAPELDTRIAILNKKAEQERLALEKDVALFIAQTVQSNVRELEGTLLRLAVRADLEKRNVDIDLARSVLGTDKLAIHHERTTSVEDVQRATSEYFGLTVKDLRGDRRHRAVAHPRMIAMYITRERLKLSYPEIGARFGGKDHTTVMNAQRKITALVADKEENTVRAVEAIERKLGL